MELAQVVEIVGHAAAHERRGVIFEQLEKLDHTLGVFVEPWSKLPIEATTLWPVSAWSNVLLFELFRVKLYSGRSFRELLFGPPNGR